MADRAQWWVFDRPLLRDPLVWGAAAIWLAATVQKVVREQHHGIADLLLSICFSLPFTFLAVGSTAGLLRELRRGRAARRRARAKPTAGSGSDSAGRAGPGADGPGASLSP